MNFGKDDQTLARVLIDLWHPDLVLAPHNHDIEELHIMTWLPDGNTEDQDRLVLLAYADVSNPSPPNMGKANTVAVSRHGKLRHWQIGRANPASRLAALGMIGKVWMSLRDHGRLPERGDLPGDQMGSS